MLETIVALATAPMKSALGIIRVSGNDAFAIVSKCFTKDLTQLKERTLLVGKIVEENEIIDEVVVAAYKGPKSFTGEDLVEIICHGSVLIANEIIKVLLKYGARLATNGEYSSRAFLNNKIDLIQAEAINDIINATTKEAKHLSTLSLSGETSKQIQPIKTQIADILSLIEVNIDFPEYTDIEVANKEKIIKDCTKIISQIDRLISNGEKALVITNGIKVALVGKPNVGKSSLLNALLGEDKAIVTDVAGTTRDVVEGDINLNGIVLHLLDTAGIRDSSDVVESIGVHKSISTLSNADLVIVILDSNNLDKEDEKILNLTKDINPIIVYNKSDLIENKLSNCIYVSALKKDVTLLKDEIYKRLGITDDSFQQPALNNVRQIGLLKLAKESLEKAISDARDDLSVDLITVNISSAYSSILEILGETNQTDISKEIFSRFCVGK